MTKCVNGPAMPLELWLAYVAICFLFAVTPGPAVLLTSGQAIARGFPAGFGVVLGTQLGNLIYFVISAAGLGAVLMASETAFSVLRSDEHTSELQSLMCTSYDDFCLK